MIKHLVQTFKSRVRHVEDSKGVYIEKEKLTKIKIKIRKIF
jgi:hypothetical protein